MAGPGDDGGLKPRGQGPETPSSHSFDTDPAKPGSFLFCSGYQFMQSGIIVLHPFDTVLLDDAGAYAVKRGETEIFLDLIHEQCVTVYRFFGPELYRMVSIDVPHIAFLIQEHLFSLIRREDIQTGHLGESGKVHFQPRTFTCLLDVCLEERIDEDCHTFR